MKFATVKPAPGRRVRLADGALVPPQGRRVAVDLHVYRAIAAGDLIEVADGTTAPARPAPAPAPAPASAPAEEKASK